MRLIYVNMQHNYVNMRLIYVNMQHNYVNMRLIYVNMHVKCQLMALVRKFTCRKKIIFDKKCNVHVNIIMLHVDIDKSHVNIIMLHVDIIYLAGRGQKYASINT